MQPHFDIRLFLKNDQRGGIAIAQLYKRMPRLRLHLSLLLLATLAACGYDWVNLATLNPPQDPNAPGSEPGTSTLAKSRQFALIHSQFGVDIVSASSANFQLQASSFDPLAPAALSTSRSFSALQTWPTTVASRRQP